MKLDWTVKDNAEAYPPFSLFDAKLDKDTIDWKVTGDHVLGGFSTSELIHHGDYIRWMGNLDTTVGLKSHIHRSGYCAIYHDTSIDLQGNYQHIEVKCRAVPNRNFTMNVTVESSIPEDLYQGQLQFINEDEAINSKNLSELTDALDKMEFESFVLPFSSLEITSRGRSRYVRRILDDRIELERLGFILKDAKNGPFVMDLHSIRAVNLNETGIIGEEAPSEEPNENAVNGPGSNAREV